MEIIIKCILTKNSEILVEQVEFLGVKSIPLLENM